jgi:hypothetical protein
MSVLKLQVMDVPKRTNLVMAPASATSSSYLCCN